MVCLGQFFMFIFLSSNSNTLHTDIYSFCKNNFHFTPVNTKGHHQNPHRCKEMCIRDRLSSGSSFGSRSNRRIYCSSNFSTSFWLSNLPRYSFSLNNCQPAFPSRPASLKNVSNLSLPFRQRKRRKPHFYDSRLTSLTIFYFH